MQNLNIGKHLKIIRQNKNLTLDETAKLTGISKPMLGQIERGQSSPTVNTLWKIATGLKIPFSAFLKEQEPEYKIVDFKSNMISEENGRMRAYTIFAFDPIHSLEMFYIEFDPKCKHNSKEHNIGVEEYIFVIDGKLDMILNGRKITVSKNQSIRFNANIEHSYVNPYDNICTVYNTIFYQNEKEF